MHISMKMVYDGYKEKWLKWLNPEKRPELFKAMTVNSKHATILTPPPKEKDTGQFLFVQVVHTYEILGQERYLFTIFVSHIIQHWQRKPNQGFREIKEEIFSSHTINTNLLLEALDITPADTTNNKEPHQSDPETKKHNERGAGRKPLNYELQKEIAECISSGKSIRKTAKELNISTRTVQKYAKILAPNH